MPDRVVAAARSIAAGWATAVCVAGFGCERPQPESPAPPGASQPIVCLQPASSSPDYEAYVALLEEHLPNAPAFSLGDLPDALRACRTSDAALLIPDVRHFPLNFWPQLERAWEDGVHLLFLGRDPFQAGAMWDADGLQTEAERRRSFVEKARVVPGLSDVQLWSREARPGPVQGLVRVARPPMSDWTGVVVDTSGVGEADLLASPIFEPGTLSDDTPRLVFHARSGKGRQLLTVEAHTRDGGLWRSGTAIDETWQPCILAPSMFTRQTGACAAPTDVEGLRFSDVVQLKVGWVNEQHPAPASYQFFGISEVRSGPAYRPAGEALRAKACRSLRLFEHVIDCPAGDVVAPEGNGRWSLQAGAAQSPVAAPRSTGGSRGSPDRWIPLFMLPSKPGRTTCAPVSLYVRTGTREPLLGAAWIAVPPLTRLGPLVQAGVQEAAERLHRGCFLLQAGVDRATFLNGEPVRVVTRWTPGTDMPMMRVTASLRDTDGRLLRRVVSSPLPVTYLRPFGNSVFLDLGRAGADGVDTQDLRLRIALEDARGQRPPFDVIEQRFKMLSAAQRKPGREAWHVLASRFASGLRPFFLHGVHYTMRSTEPAQWMHAGVFDGEQVVADLEAIREAGFEAISLDAGPPEVLPQLRFLVDEAARQGLRVLLKSPNLPLDEPAYDRWKEALLGLCRQRRDALSAVVFPYPATCRERPAIGHVHPHWTNWVREQFGSIEHAETLYGTLADGPPGVPERTSGQADGSARDALLRRFYSDVYSRAVGHLVRRLRRDGLEQFVGLAHPPPDGSARQGTGFRPEDVSLGALHVDFMCPSSEGLPLLRDRLPEASFLNAYARGISHGKPVLWLDLRYPMVAPPDEMQEQEQGQFLSNALDMALRGRAAGAFVRQYAPGPNGVDFDYGLTRRSGTWRAAGRRLKERMLEMRGIPPAAGVWQGRTMDRTPAPSGLHALWDAWRDVYARELAEGVFREIRPEGFGEAAAAHAQDAPGTIVHRDPCPLARVNAEWTAIRVDGSAVARAPWTALSLRVGQHLEAELLNTGPATWTLSRNAFRNSVWVRILRNGHQSENLRLEKSRSFGETATVRWIAREPGTFVLRPRLARAGGFGEQLIVEVRPGDEAPSGGSG